jgi:hypothetical protein
MQTNSNADTISDAHLNSIAARIRINQDHTRRLANQGYANLAVFLLPSETYATSTLVQKCDLPFPFYIRDI